MSRLFRYIMLLGSLGAIMVIATGCWNPFKSEMAHVVFENNTVDNILYYPSGDKAGQVCEMRPGDLFSQYYAMSVKETVRWTYPDGTGGKSISFRPDAERRDAHGPDGEIVDTWITASGSVQRAIAVPSDYWQRLITDQPGRVVIIK